MEDEQSNPTGSANAESAPAHAQGGEDALAQAVARYRELIAGTPGLVPEMVQGSTIEEVDASANASREAYAQISRRIAAEHEARIPTGNSSRSYSDANSINLKPEAKIALGLRGK